MRPLSYYETGFGLLAISFPIFLNSVRKRPGFAGIQLHIAAGVLGVLIGNRWEKYVQGRQERKLQILEEFIAAHPADFEEPPPKKWSEVFQSWEPTR